MRTWQLHNRQTGAGITVILTEEALLTVIQTPKYDLPRSDQRKLKDYGGALAYVEKFILERKIRGFTTIADSYLDGLRAEQAAAAATAAAAPPKTAAEKLLVNATVKRPGWVTVGAGGRVDADALDTLLGPGIDALQLVCDDNDDDDNDDDDDDEDEDDGDEDRGTPASVNWLKCVGRKDRPALRTLVLDTFWQTLVRQVDSEHGYFWGRVSPCLATLSALEQAYVAGVFSFTPLVHARLRNLTLLSGNMTPVVKNLSQSTLPALTDLGLGGSGEVDVGDDAVAALCALLQSDALPALVDLDLDGFGDPLVVLEAAARRRGWRSLHIAGALDEESDEDDVVARLLKVAPAFAGASVAIALDTLSEPGLEAVQKAWPGLVDHDNHGLFLPGRYSGW